MKFAVLLAGASVVLVAASCPTNVNLKFDSAESLNRNKHGESTPVEVRVFQLKNRETFDRANIEALWGNRYKETLGDDLVGEPRPYTFFASSSRTETVKDIPKGVRFLGVMAMFSGTAENHWRVSVDIEKVTRFEFELADDRMSLKK